MTDLKEAIKKNPFILAPMAGITDVAFRSFMKEMGTSLVITELVSATGLCHGSDKSKKLMQFEPDQGLVGVQIFGHELKDLGEGAKIVQDSGAAFVDLNFGCPVNKVVKKGAGSAILKDLDEVKRVFQTVKKSVNIPVTVKTRTGWDDNSRNMEEFVKIAAGEGLEWVAIHGRTREQAYSGKADWDYIAKIKQSSPLPIIGNGDIVTSDLANERIKVCDGVMIGRGCLKDPWIFQAAMEQMSQKTDSQKKDFMTLFDRLSFFLHKHFEERIVLLQLKKFSSWYSSGYPASSDFRRSLFSAKSVEDIEAYIKEFFAKHSQTQQKDTSHEDFLMGGHG